MGKVSVINNTGTPLIIIDQVGTSWRGLPSEHPVLPADGKPHLASVIDDETAGHSAYGWIKLGIDDHECKWQLYVWLRKVQTDDYAVQLVGDDKNDKTLPDTIAEKDGSDITFTLNFVAPPQPILALASERLGLDVNDIAHFAQKYFPSAANAFMGLTRDQMVYALVVACKSKEDELRKALNEWTKS